MISAPRLNIRTDGATKTAQQRVESAELKFAGEVIGKRMERKLGDVEGGREVKEAKDKKKREVGTSMMGKLADGMERRLEDADGKRE